MPEGEGHPRSASQSGASPMPPSATSSATAAHQPLPHGPGPSRMVFRPIQTDCREQACVAGT